MALKTGNQFIDALGGTPWPKEGNTGANGATVLTYFFDDANSPGGAWMPYEKFLLNSAMRTWSSVANIRFLEVDSAAAADLIERKVTNAELPPPTPGTISLGNHDFPDDSTHVGQFNTSQFWSVLEPGSIMYNTFVHEIGHAIGLAHPHDGGMGTGTFPGAADGSTGSNSLNQDLNTIMSYNRPFLTAAQDQGSAATPMAFDIAAIQLLYGAVANNAGNTVYTLPDKNVSGTGFSCIWDTGGTDTIQTNSTSDTTIDLRPAFLGDHVNGGGFISRTAGVNGGFTIAADITGFIPDKNGVWGVIIENATGGSGNDTLFGNDVNNALRGRGGNDHLNGYGGADSMWGGIGNDQYVVDDAGDTVIDVVGVTGGEDRIFTSLNTYNMSLANKGTAVEHLQFFGKGDFVGTGNALDNWVIGGEGNDDLSGGAGNDHLAGGEGNDTLSGGAHNDWLNGGIGADTMRGGSGNDTYLVDNFGDRTIEAAGFGRNPADPGGIDTVEVDLPEYQLGSRIENLTYVGAGQLKGTGNALDNVIQGGNGGDDSHGDWLLGGAGNDAIYGWFGGDRLEGQAGHDDMHGGRGNDAFVIDNGDAFRGDFVDGGEGHDWVWADDSIAATGLRLNLFSTQIDLGPGGGGGADDTAAGAGLPPIVHVAGASAAINVERVDGTAVGDVIDASRLKTLEGLDVYGLAGDDTFFGGRGADMFDGGDNTDTIVLMGSHTDYLFATLGNAVYTLTSIASEIVDTVMATELFTFADGTFTLADLVATIVTRGTEGADTLIGDGYSNILEGLGGDDTLIGLASADTLDGGTGVDTADYSGSAAGVSVNLATGIGSGGDAEGDTLVAIENLVGSAFNDALTGGTDRGKFLGGDGADTLVGGSIFDWMEGGTGNDTIAGTGGQTVQFGGDGDDTLTGSLDNTNYFAGGAGNDVMRGGNTTDYISDVDGGNDWMYGGGGNDTLVDYAGVDHLYGEDGDDFMTSIGSGSFLDGGAGNDYMSVANGDYTLIGGSGSDTLEASGHGNVTFTGGVDADVFTYRIFGNGPLSYTVNDFEDGVDKILLWDHKYYGDSNPNLGLDSLTITDSAAGAVISWNGTSEMTLTGVEASQLSVSDFLFA